MRLRLLCAFFAISAALVSAVPGQAAANRNLLDELGLSEFPGAKLVTEISVPAGPLLDKIQEEFGELLAITSISKVDVVSYAVDPDATSQEIFEFYRKDLSEPKWSVLLQVVDKSGSATSIQVNDRLGMLIMNIDAPGRERHLITLVRAAGSIDKEKLANLDRKFEEKVAPFLRSRLAGIPVDQPISVPPSDSLRIEAMKSDVKARISGRNTVQVGLANDALNAGELSRTDDGELLLSITPKLPVSEMTLPANVPVKVEVTDGAFTLTGPNDRPAELTITATGAKVKISDLQLAGGEQSIKSVGGPVDVTLSGVRGGSLSILNKGGDISLGLPKDASAIVKITAPAGQIKNLTEITPTDSAASSITLQSGTGKAEITLEAVNGTVTLTSVE